MVKPSTSARLLQLEALQRIVSEKVKPAYSRALFLQSSGAEENKTINFGFIQIS